MGEKPITRSGPYFFAVYSMEATISSRHWSQLGAAESAFPSRCLILVTLFFILHDRCPGLDRIGVFGSSALPKIHQDAAQIRILHPQRAVNVPGIHDARAGIRAARTVAGCFQASDNRAPASPR